MREALGFLLAVCVLFLSGCAPRSQKTPSKTPEELDAAARSFVLALASGKYDEATKIFSKEMTAAMPVSKLGELWSMLLAQGGPWKQIQETRFAQEAGYRIIYVTAAFEKGSIDMKVVFDNEGKVSGLWLAPFQAASASMKYIAPAYVDENSFTEKDVVVGQSQWALPGTLTMPKGKGPFPAVVLVHGSGPQDRDETLGPNKPFKDLGWGLASKGIAVLRYDKRTKHYPDEMKSLKHLTVREETIDDALAAVELLKRTPGIDPQRVFVIGHSLGATLAPRIAKECLTSPDTRIAGIIMLAPAKRDLLDLILDQMEYIAGLDGTITDAESRAIEATKSDIERIRSKKLREGEMVLNAPKSYWDDLASYDAVATAREIRLPILILQGERDYQVTMEDLKGWKEGLMKQGQSNLLDNVSIPDNVSILDNVSIMDNVSILDNVSIMAYKDLNHLFMKGQGMSTPDEYQAPGHVSEQVITDISAWVKTAGGVQAGG